MFARTLAAVIFFSALTANASGGFPTMADFSRYTDAQMRAMPDVRVPLCKRLSTRNLAQKSKLELSLMKNSIFAQVGYQFNNASYRSYFTARAWYRGLSKYQPEKLCTVDHENGRAISALIANAADRPSSGDNAGYGGYGGYEGGYEGGYGYDQNGYGGYGEN